MRKISDLSCYQMQFWLQWAIVQLSAYIFTLYILWTASGGHATLVLIWSWIFAKNIWNEPEQIIFQSLQKSLTSICFHYVVFFFFHGRLLWFLIGERGIKENQIMIALDPQNKKVKGTFMKHFASLNVYDCQSLVIDCILISPIYFYF